MYLCACVQYLYTLLSKRGKTARQAAAAKAATELALSLACLTPQTPAGIRGAMPRCVELFGAWSYDANSTQQFAQGGHRAGSAVTHWPA